MSGKAEILAQSGPVVMVVGRILGWIPDVLSCCGLVVGIVLSLWMVKKAKAQTRLLEREIELKGLEIENLRKSNKLHLIK